VVIPCRLRILAFILTLLGNRRMMPRPSRRRQIFSPWLRVLLDFRC
jgi:hypothetical protein